MANKLYTKKILILAMAILLLLPNISLAATAKAKVASKTTKTVVAKPKVLTANDLLGRFLIQKQSYNRLWYVSKTDKKRYYIKDDSDLKWVMENFAQKLTQAELNKIPVNAKSRTKANMAVAQKYYGAVVYASSTSSSAKASYWYVNPGDSIRYGLNSYADVYNMAKVIGLTVDDATLRKVVMNDKQLTFDATFNSVAYVKYDGSQFVSGSNANTILPIASLTKLMTALVLNDLAIDWTREVTITEEEINYPKIVVNGDATSEVPLEAGDSVRMSDLWIAMLTASSNQSAVILADNSGLNREEFVVAMNKKAKELGLKKTKFYEMTGLDPNNVSTPQDMALIANSAFVKEKIA
ncbi:MAG: serine hydrolase, partial [Patescibacteria group bacterium]